MHGILYLEVARKRIARVSTSIHVPVHEHL